nr:hypothetical protein BaRGS_016027 [Batillaria attramentaria]
MLDLADYVPEKIKPSAGVTLHQFVSYFKVEGGLQKIEQVAEELQLCDQLMSGNTDRSIKAILTLREDIPDTNAPQGHRHAAEWCCARNSTVSKCLPEVISRNKQTRDKAMVVFVEGLEDNLPDVRAGACAALSVLEAIESIDQLVYVCQADSSSTVRRKAKEALYSLGDEAERHWRRRSSGPTEFQGMQIKK